MLTMRSVARVVPGLRLIDTPQSIKPWRENQRLYLYKYRHIVGCTPTPACRGRGHFVK
ncbi:hypothetical protein HanRHA438_Chr04g0178131 [Helianthus annuus]|nr:hypothetical protein HanRHA438_Chr04g0178131 [Helianthus annuus]